MFCYIRVITLGKFKLKIMLGDINHAKKTFYLTI